MGGYENNTIVQKERLSERISQSERNFLSSVVSKLFEKLIKVRIAEIIAKISVWQAGATENRSTQDQTFLLRSAVNHAVYLILAPLNVGL